MTILDDGGGAVQGTPSVGTALNRVDGRLKVTGGARYAAEAAMDRLAYAVIVQSTVARGTITHLDTSVAVRLPGVLAVITPDNAPQLPKAGRAAVAPPSGRVLSLLQDHAVRYNGEPIGLVVAESFEQATHAASLVRVSYRVEAPTIDMTAALPTARPYTQKINGAAPASSLRGNIDAGLAQATRRVDAVYTTPIETHNAMEPHATTASWDGDQLTLHDSTQYVYGVKRTVAKTFGIPDTNVRVLTPFTGGAFGSKGSPWSHVVLAAMAARKVGRPVKLVLSRRQMFGLVGARPYTVQHVTLGARDSGTLTAIRHRCISSTSMLEDWLEPSALATRLLYACDNAETSHSLVKLNIGTPTFNRGPGESSGLFALESAMDELAVALQMDPIALRLANYAEADPDSGKPWSSKSLKECYAQGAGRFGWSRRTPKPRSMRDGDALIGWGVASATYPSRQSAASAIARVLPDGSAVVLAATHELGTGTYTVMTQLAADALGLPPDRVRFELGDSDLPENPISAGSMTASSTGSAVQAAASAARDKLIDLAIADDASPLHGAARQDVRVEMGQLSLAGDLSRAERFEVLIARHGGQPIEARADSKPADDQKQYSINAFGAVFAEVRVDEALNEVRATRIVGAYGAGRILNAKTARSQMLGGIVYGLGMALTEHTAIDARTGRYISADLAEYLVPINADVSEIDVIFVDEHDAYVNPIGVKGIGEIGTTGVAAAVANAVHHATGIRVRDLPVTIDKLLGVRAD